MSGIVTVPKVIEAGESVTVPAGRVAVLPNVQVDGELVVDGEVFIPSGSGLSTVVQKSGDTMTGNLAITTTSTTASIETSVSAGTTSGRLVTYPQAHASRAGTTWLTTQSSSPLVLGTSNVERMRIDTAGNVGINRPAIDKLTVGGNISVGSLSGTTYTDASGVLFFRGIDNTQAAYIGFGSVSTPIEFVNSKGNGYSFYGGEVLQKTAYGIGYGTGAGGTVTQLTSKSTAVTLNKPTGIITMNNAALAAGGQVTFSLNNSLITVNDIIVVHCTHANGFAYYVWAGYSTAGSAQVTVKNTAASSLSDAITINFAVIKGAIA